MTDSDLVYSRGAFYPGTKCVDLESTQAYFAQTRPCSDSLFSVSGIENMNAFTDDIMTGFVALLTFGSYFWYGSARGSACFLLQIVMRVI